ncbi:XRE family transcriptional regulator [Bacillus sp. AFS017336]|uniref:XRE family transcriptional regulator n=1 Tax=Bacillus sp. AFS017336 TaxID=2033489 RepID=UPI000BEF4088|nr:XRE family transcriptional regulator [Bacillus sp. AFS017336]PEL06733.1 XRE family transcriptional regulator [Bacillus sp. AFS017336]
MGFNFKLAGILKDLEQTKNSIAVESKVRPATIHDLVEGNTKRIELPTIERVLDTINKVAKDAGKNKTYTLDDLIEYTKEDADE